LVILGLILALSSIVFVSMNVGACGFAAPCPGKPGNGGGGRNLTPHGETSVVLHVVVVVTIISQVVNVHPVLKLVTVPSLAMVPAPIIPAGAVLSLSDIALIVSGIGMGIAGLVMTFACASRQYFPKYYPPDPCYQSPETPAYKDGEDGYKDGEDGYKDE
jgi:hypothetical protein